MKFWLSLKIQKLLHGHRTDCKEIKRVRYQKCFYILIITEITDYICSKKNAMRPIGDRSQRWYIGCPVKVASRPSFPNIRDLECNQRVWKLDKKGGQWGAAERRRTDDSCQCRQKTPTFFEKKPNGSHINRLRKETALWLRRGLFKGVAKVTVCGLEMLLGINASLPCLPLTRVEASSAG